MQLQSRQVSFEPEHWFKWVGSLGCGSEAKVREDAVFPLPNISSNV